jgi:hypothetical protein
VSAETAGQDILRIEELAEAWLAEPQQQHITMMHTEKLGTTHQFELRTQANISSHPESAAHDSRYVYIIKGSGARREAIMSFELNGALAGASREEMQHTAHYDSQAVSDVLAETLNLRPEAYRLLGSAALLAERAATGALLPQATLQALDRVYRLRMEDACVRTERVCRAERTGLGVTVFGRTMEGNLAHALPIDYMEAALTVEARSVGVGTVYARGYDGARETYARKIPPPAPRLKVTKEEWEEIKADPELHAQAKMGGLAAQAVVRQAERLLHGTPDVVPAHLTVIRAALEAFER